MRAVGVDLGSKRIGLSLSNSEGTIATPYEMVQRSGDLARDHREISKLAHEAGAEILVVGLPLHLDGRMSERAKEALAEAEQLGVTSGLPVETYDERLSTVTAERSIREMNVSPKKRRQIVDKLAAAVLLQAWLDAQHHKGSDPQETKLEDPSE